MTEQITSRVGARAKHKFNPLRCGALMTAAVLFTVGLGSMEVVQAEPSAPLNGAYGAADPVFQNPYIEVDEWRDEPVRHRYIRGGFKDSDLRFSFYFPDKDQYQGRFFQHLDAMTPQIDDTPSHESGPNSRIAFAFESGGYLVASNMGGVAARSDPTLGGFRASAAAADYSRVVAMQLFGGERPYGYVYGGSGGAFRTFSAIENTDVWDGAVPYVPGSPRANGIVATGHERVGRILKDKLPQVLDEIDAGGSGNPYTGLDKDEEEALREMLRFAVPLEIFSVGQPDLAIGSSEGIPPDPSYVEDFWTKEGYEGADPDSYAARARVHQYKTTVGALLTEEEATQRGLPRQVTQDGTFINPVGVDTASQGEEQESSEEASAGPAIAAIQLTSVPDKDLRGAMLIVKTGAAAGTSIPLGRSAGDVVAPGAAVAMDPRIAFFTGAGAALEAAFSNLAMLKPGDEVELDNSASLAADVYNRHVVPEGDYLPWAQYLDAEGKPIHPQRDRLPDTTGGRPPAGGTVPTGKFKPKVIMVASLWDELAAPWNADWYARRAKEHWGPEFNDNFRLWYTDRAMHTDSVAAPSPTRVVSYVGVLHQALRDVAAWVEEGVPPSPSTSYRFVDGQIVVPPTAAERGGIQPVVNVLANGNTRADVSVGQAVSFSAEIEVPPGTGEIIVAEWDFDGAGTFPIASDLPPSSASTVQVTATHTFTEPGTYFPTLRATSHREGDLETPFARIHNLGRVRVVVK